MVIAYNKNKERVHVDEAIRGEKYYCQTCGEELCIKRGNIKSHHFAHLSTSSCDGWHYDMSEWHNSWQNQFPLENQEVIFELEGKKHRADVFINNTVIEFQHSKISIEEFEERNKFYNLLGYRVIWIFDTTEVYLNKDIKEDFNKENFSWKNQLIQLRNYDIEKVDVYFQEFNNIWYSTPDYKEISIWNDDLIDYAWLHHVDSLYEDDFRPFYSDGKKNIYDYEFIDKFIPVRFLHDGSFDISLDMEKRFFTIDGISDKILTPEEKAFGGFSFIWCPSAKYFVNPNDECHACTHLSIKNYGCKFRFENLLSKEFDRVINIEYYDDGKVEYITILKNKKRYRIKYDKAPEGIFTINEAFENKNNTQIVRLRNIKSRWKVQITKYNYDMIIKNNKCYGKVQGPDVWNFNFSKKEFEIFNFNKKEWEIIWRK